MFVAADFIFKFHKERLVLKEQHHYSQRATSLFSKNNIITLKEQHFVVLKKRPIRSLKKYIQYY